VIVFIDSLNVAEGRSTPIGITTDNLVPDDYKLTNEDFVIELLEVDTVENEASYDHDYYPWFQSSCPKR
jgi:hypothetical protein